MRAFPVRRENKGTLVNHTQTENLKEHEEERDLFCVGERCLSPLRPPLRSHARHAWAFAGAVLVIAVWLLTGPTFHFSDTWQLIINTATPIITFLMVFLIQNTQNRDAKAMHLKLDEIIRALKKARNELVDLEDLFDEELQKLEEQFKQLRKKPNATAIILATRCRQSHADSSGSGGFWFSRDARSQKDFATWAKT
jgi:low affinity Fe/Cu permease